MCHFRRVETRDSTPPRLSARMKSLRRERNRSTAFLPPASSKLTISAEAGHLPLGKRMARVAGEPGIIDPVNLRMLV